MAPTDNGNQEHQYALHEALKLDMAAIAETVNQTTASATTLQTTVETISEKIGLIASLGSTFRAVSVMLLAVVAFIVAPTAVARCIVSIGTSHPSSV